MCHNADGGQRQQPASVRALAATAPPMPADHEEREDDGQEQERRDAVRDSTPESQAVPQRNRDDIDVGKIRSDHQRGGTESSPPLQARFSERSADQRVADVVHYYCPPRMRSGCLGCDGAPLNRTWDVGCEINCTAITRELIGSYSVHPTLSS